MIWSSEQVSEKGIVLKAGFRKGSQAFGRDAKWHGLRAGFTKIFRAHMRGQALRAALLPVD